MYFSVKPDKMFRIWTTLSTDETSCCLQRDDRDVCCFHRFPPEYFNFLTVDLHFTTEQDLRRQADALLKQSRQIQPLYSSSINLQIILSINRLPYWLECKTICREIIFLKVFCFIFDILRYLYIPNMRYSFWIERL